MDEAVIESRLRVWARYADAAIVADHELVEYIAGYFPRVFVVAQRVWLDDYEPVYPDPGRTPPVVIHAPSHRGAKGTEFILAAFEELAQDGTIRPLVVEGRTHRESLRLYAEADVIVDQVRLGTYGLLAVEAMALGKPVITYIREDLRPTYPGSLPIMSADPNSLKSVLFELAQNGELRRQLGILGRKYAEDYHDARKVASQLIEIYRTL